MTYKINKVGTVKLDLQPGELEHDNPDFHGDDSQSLTLNLEITLRVESKRPNADYFEDDYIELQYEAKAEHIWEYLKPRVYDMIAKIDPLKNYRRPNDQNHSARDA